ncbi:MAG: hypothetical protein K8G78_11275 [Deltaproteobacteria bacterium]|nr:hypothetical protein [Candidatus Kapabacteria bacterium]
MTTILQRISMKFLHCAVILAIAVGTLDTAMIARPSADTSFNVKFGVQGSPFIEAFGGQSTFGFDGFSDFGSSVATGLRFGFDTPESETNNMLTHSNRNGIYVNWIMDGDTAVSQYTSGIWNFGFVGSESIGYKLSESGNQSIEFINTKEPISWFVMDFPTLGSDSIRNERLTRFDGVRFGESSGAGIGIRVMPGVTLSGNVEWAQVYEHHLFWYWTMSSIISGVADGIGSYFVDAVGRSSPMAKPIVHFIIRNGIAMGFKALKRNQMNWPFNTTAPLNIFTIGGSITVVF